jgi:DNA-binding NtrC family response regulator
MSERASNDDRPIGRRALVLSTDLFFAVKIVDTLKHAGYTARSVRRLGAFTEGLVEAPPDIVLVNTAEPVEDWRAAIRAARAANLPIVAFGAHVDVETQRQAREEGATVVVANSKLAQDLSGVVARALRLGGASGDTAAQEGAAEST